MTTKACLTVLATLLALTLPGGAMAQVAAETATILSGTGQGTGSAARGMGSAVAGSMNRASSQIRAAQNGEAAPRRGRSRGGMPATGFEIPATGDILEGTDAATYQMGNGASIRTSGSLRRPAAVSCTENCVDSSSAPEPAPQP
jgi:hypothetical protein